MQLAHVLELIDIAYGHRPTVGDTGVAALRVDEVIVSFGPSTIDGAAVMRAYLGEVDIGDVSVLSSLLQSNLLPATASAASLGLDASGAAFLVQRLEQTWVDASDCMHALDRFVARAEACIELVSTDALPSQPVGGHLA